MCKQNLTTWVQYTYLMRNQLGLFTRPKYIILNIAKFIITQCLDQLRDVENHGGLKLEKGDFKLTNNPIQL